MNDGYDIPYSDRYNYTPAIYDQQQLSLIWDVLTNNSPEAIHMRQIIGNETTESLERIFATRMMLLARRAEKELKEDFRSDARFKSGYSLGRPDYSEEYNNASNAQTRLK